MPKLLLTLFSLGVCTTGAMADATITTGPAGTLGDEAPFSASVNGSYSALAEYGESSVIARVQANVDEYTAQNGGVSFTYRDALQYSGTVAATSSIYKVDVGVSIPTLDASDVFTFQGGVPGQNFAWSVTGTANAHLVTNDPASGPFRGAYIDQMVSANIFRGPFDHVSESDSDLCFDYNAGCETLQDASSPTDVDKTFTLSGTAQTGDKLYFDLAVKGIALFTPVFEAGVVNGSLLLDPTVRLNLPSGISVTSAQGVIPGVPEPTTVLLLAAGIGALAVRGSRAARR